jgi:hypothetical protein
LVTTTFFAPAVFVGAVQVIDVAVAVTLVAATPPICTVAPDRFVPEIVNTVPPAVGPIDGATVEIVGAGRYVKPFVFVTLPPGAVTTTLFAPTLPAGVVQVIDVAVAATFVADTPPIFTVAPVRFVPVIVIEVPPAIGPDVGVTVEIVGAAR